MNDWVPCNSPETGEKLKRLSNAIYLCNLSMQSIYIDVEAARDQRRVL